MIKRCMRDINTLHMRIVMNNMVIRKINPTDSREEISNVYEQSWKFAYNGIIAQEYLDSIPSGQ